MKTYKEFMEAILAGEILYKDLNGLKMKLCPTTGNLVLQEGNGKWVDYLLYEFPHYHDWRILPKIIIINGIEVPEPERKLLAMQQKYYLVSLDTEDVRVQQWSESYYDYTWLNRGVIHLTKEAATVHRDALLSFTQK